MKKTALLFGINKYLDCPLKNAVNDAAALADKLKGLGFDVKCFLDIDTATMDRELVTFKDILSKSNVGLFFFAGHGIQCKGENFLATTSTSFTDESSCKYTSLPLNFVIDTFEESGANTKIIILDACRNNPFVTWRSVTNDGLAPVYAPKGTIIAFSTSPGQKASDGSNNHGIYTNALLMHIATKNLSIEDMFKRVRNTVSSHTHHKQITWEHTSLMGTFYFNSDLDEGKATATYSDSALADQNYMCEDDSIQNIIDALKSYNWYKQNPAISQLEQMKFIQSDKDDLFVLGRNIYQAACGGSGNAENWINNINSNLLSIDDNASIHLLNGILFEIYFNCKGQIRTSPKSVCFEKPIKMCQKHKYISCSVFIRSFLEQYPQKIFYMPGSTDLLTIDVLISQSDNEYHIDGIYIDGLSCMYDEDEVEFYKHNDSDYFCQEVTSDKLEIILMEKIVIPKSRAKFTYNENISSDTKILVPYNFSILRYI